jgi:hypothetical protein
MCCGWGLFCAVLSFIGSLISIGILIIGSVSLNMGPSTLDSNLQLGGGIATATGICLVSFIISTSYYCKKHNENKFNDVSTGSSSYYPPLRYTVKDEPNVYIISYNAADV